MDVSIEKSNNMKPGKGVGREAAGPVGDRMAKLARKGKLTAKNADLHWLYEQSVQNPEVEVEFIDRVFKKEFGRKPRDLREDFCGTAFLCSHWVKEREDNTALGVDLDGPTLEWGRVNNIEPLGARASAIRLVQQDVRTVDAPNVDVLAATNFSWWGFKTREELGGYLRNCHANLNDEGMLMMDCYGGPRPRCRSSKNASRMASIMSGTRTPSIPSPTKFVA